MTPTEKRARAFADAGTVSDAVASGAVEQFQDLSVAEALVIGLRNQGVEKYIGIFGHGSTAIADVLRVYEEYGLVSTWNVRHETEASHAATAYKMLTGETPAVFTSIGPGSMHAFAGSLVAASNGAGVYHIYGDETTHDEGFNFQQIPRDEQGLFLKLHSVMGNTYSLYEPYSLFTALRRGAIHMGKRGFSGPFFLLAPMNVQPFVMRGCNLLAFPSGYSETAVHAAGGEILENATELVRNSEKITIKIGGGARGCGKEITELAGLIDAAIVSGPGSTGIVPYSEERYMSVGGSKGSLSGNFCMNRADLVIIIGARGVCQWDCSGTAWKNARHIINFNTESQHAGHYNRTLPVPGDARTNLSQWISYLKEKGFSAETTASKWAEEISSKKAEWQEFKNERYRCEPLYDDAWKMKVMTQPVAIKTVVDFADSAGAVKYFDAGDVQANGFQIVEDENEYQTFTDTGSSYMGFAPCAIMATAMCDRDIYAIALCGDGSFMMNPQILIDAVEHGVRGCVVVFDNRRMSAISGLQKDQYGKDYRTWDSVEVDYAAMASSVRGVQGLYGGTDTDTLKAALQKSLEYDGLSLIHVPVYYGDNELGGMGVFGDWNVGNWCESVQKERHRLGF